ncbi:DoxX family protein [Balneola sp. MJW-20]|uniref:DoxX family protein n=1 Tax=Gracilimonas aurantiaca TaxID=3234185 RepID=UPI003466F352
MTAFFFIFYGIQSLRSDIMIQEFKRFGLTDSQRKITGILQVAGAVGLLSGLYFPFFGAAASIGLTIMMLVAFIVRIKIKDSLMETIPSFFFMLINAYITLLFFV